MMVMNGAWIVAMALTITITMVIMVLGRMNDDGGPLYDVIHDKSRFTQYCKCMLLYTLIYTTLLCAISL